MNAVRASTAAIHSRTALAMNLECALGIGQIEGLAIDRERAF
jgi:hypothetical protein